MCAEAVTATVYELVERLTVSLVKLSVHQKYDLQKN